MKGSIEQELQKVLNNSIDNRKIFGASFSLRHKDYEWEGSAGNLKTEDQYFIASTTKLFVTAIILNLKNRGFIELEDHLNLYIEDTLLKNLHIYKGKDYSNTICIKKLLAHTSGIPDYFQHIDTDGNSLELEIKNGKDRKWTLEEVLKISKSFVPYFPPNCKGKAHYSDTNFRLLGKIIENITNKSFAENVHEIICKPIGLKQTYLYTHEEDTRPRTMYFKKNELHIPQAMSSFDADGGVVSTSKDMMAFIHHFFSGTFFPQRYIKELQVWNKIFFPFRSGIGIHQFKLPWYLDPFGTIPELIGHSGLSGSIAFYAPDKDIYITGTVNQIAYPEMSFRTAIKLVRKLASAMP